MYFMYYIMNNLNYNMTLTYHKLSEENNEIVDDIYRKELLEVFNICDRFENDDQFDYFSHMSTIVCQIYNKIISNINEENLILFNEVNTISSSKIFTDDLETGFLLLFSFETFYLVYDLIKIYKNTNNIDKDIISKIKNILIN